jgi:hypothetical protein
VHLVLQGSNCSDGSISGGDQPTILLLTVCYSFHRCANRAEASFKDGLRKETVCQERLHFVTKMGCEGCTSQNLGADEVQVLSSRKHLGLSQKMVSRGYFIGAFDTPHRSVLQSVT